MGLLLHGGDNNRVNILLDVGLLENFGRLGLVYGVTLRGLVDVIVGTAVVNVDVIGILLPDFLELFFRDLSGAFDLEASLLHFDHLLESWSDHGFGRQLDHILNRPLLGNSLLDGFSDVRYRRLGLESLEALQVFLVAYESRVNLSVQYGNLLLLGLRVLVHVSLVDIVLQVLEVLSEVHPRRISLLLEGRKQVPLFLLKRPPEVQVLLLVRHDLLHVKQKGVYLGGGCGEGLGRGLVGEVLQIVRI